MILVAASSPVLVGYLTGVLCNAGYVVRVASSPFIAADALPGVQLVVLISSKCGLLSENICNICSLVRINAPKLPIIVVGPDDTNAKVTLFELGADDYIVEPFDHREFLARVKGVIRRQQFDLS